jgi:hypothetical protein
VYNIYFQQAILTNNFQGEFEGLDIISSGVSLDKSMDREKTIKDLFKDHTGSLFVEPDEANNRVIFHVMKKLNWFKTSKRHIVIDLEKKVLRNETIHGVVCVHLCVCMCALACMCVCVCVFMRKRGHETHVCTDARSRVFTRTYTQIRITSCSPLTSRTHKRIRTRRPHAQAVSV